MQIIEKSQHRCEKCGCLYEFDKSDWQTRSVEKDDRLRAEFEKSLLFRCVSVPNPDTSRVKVKHWTQITTFVSCPECHNEFQLGLKRSTMIKVSYPKFCKLRKRHYWKQKFLPFLKHNFPYYYTVTPVTISLEGKDWNDLFENLGSRVDNDRIISVIADLDNVYYKMESGIRYIVVPGSNPLFFYREL